MPDNDDIITLVLTSCRPRNRYSRTPSNTKYSELLAEEIFRRIDTSGNGMVDAGEWVNFSTRSSIWDFVNLLNDADVNGKLKFIQTLRAQMK